METTKYYYINFETNVLTFAMRITLYFLLISISCTTVSSAQKISATTLPESVGFSAERLKRLDANMKSWVDQGWMNGAVALVIRNGKIVYFKSAGYNDLQAKTALAKDGIFRIASQTKAITSVAVMMLYEEGKFLLDDPVSKFIPSFAKATVLDKFNEKDSTYTSVPAARDVSDLLTWGGAFSTTYWVDPKEKIVALLYRQMWGSHSEIDNLFRVLVYQAISD